jgi:hypothetical protein
MQLRLSLSLSLDYEFGMPSLKTQRTAEEKKIFPQPTQQLR